MITVDEYDVLRKMFFADKNLKDKEDFKQEKNKEN